MFNAETFHSIERGDVVPVTDSSDSTDETRLKRRSIRIPNPTLKNGNGKRSRSNSHDRRISELSSSEENLSSTKTK